jgi:hypothetical protein
LNAALAAAELDRVITSSENTFFHARFALAITAPSEFVAVFDDDSIPGPDWFANCLETIAATPGILGTAGIVLHGPGYGQRTMHGWQRPNDRTIEVDLVGQAWFLRTEWVRHLFAAQPVTGTNGEDIELAARAFRLAGIRCYCPPHPPADSRRWGSTRGLELGVDQVAASLTRGNHEAERDAIVRAEIGAGWVPLFRRPLAIEETSGRRPPAIAGSNPNPHSDFTACPKAVPSDPLSAPLTLVYGDDGLAASTTASCAAQTSCDAYVTDAAGIEAQLSAGPYDNIDLGEWLALESNPLAALTFARGQLAPGGQITATFANARHHGVVGALLAGEWKTSPVDHNANGPGETGGTNAPHRIFTVREFEKLCFRAGLDIVELLAEPNDELKRWQTAGSPGEVHIGALHMTGLAASDAEQFYATYYRVVAASNPKRASVAGDQQSATNDRCPQTSIVVVTHNALAFTQQLLSNLPFFTDEPFDLIPVRSCLGG